MRASNIRFSGLASGLDTDSIIKDMLRPQQYKIDNRKKDQALLKLKQDAWKDMNKKLLNFHTKYTSSMRLESTFNKFKTTSSNENAMSIAKDARVPEGTHTFTIEELAKSANVVGKVGDYVSHHTSDGDFGDVTVANLTGKNEDVEISMEVNGKPITLTVKGTDTLSDVAKKLNNRLKTDTEDTGFVASLDEKNGGFFISSKATGAEQKIKIEDNDLFSALGIKTGEEITGQNAKYTYNDMEFESASNAIEINGIKANLKAAGTGPITITSEQDPEALYSFIKEFVTEYNSLIDEVHTKLGTKPGKDMKPLTAEERKGMSESEIELWEEKINNSLFYKDPQLTEFVDSARKILGQVIGEGDDAQSLSKYGIVTGKWEERGKLHILGDEDFPLYAKETNKLKEAIQNNASEVGSFFQQIGESLYKDHDKKLISSNDLKSSMNFYNDKILTDKMNDFNKEIDTLEERLYRLEQRHYAKFAAMEKMLNSLNSQSSWLSQQFGG